MARKVGDKRTTGSVEDILLSPVQKENIQRNEEHCSRILPSGVCVWGREGGLSAVVVVESRGSTHTQRSRMKRSTGQEWGLSEPDANCAGGESGAGS